MKLRLVCPWTLWAFASVACGSNMMQQGPSDALRTYAHAIEDGRIDDAYRQLSIDARRQLSLEAFRALVRENPEETREIARGLTRPVSPPVVTATVTPSSGDPLLLVFEGGHFRLDGAAIDLYGQRTPKQALEGFVRAYDRKRFDILLRFVPTAELEGLTAAKLQASWDGPEKGTMSRIVAAIRATLPTAPIEQTVDRASMSYGLGGTIELVREHGAWKIEDF